MFIVRKRLGAKRLPEKHLIHFCRARGVRKSRIPVFFTEDEPRCPDCGGRGKAIRSKHKSRKRYRDEIARLPQLMGKTLRKQAGGRTR